MDGLVGQMREAASLGRARRRGRLTAAAWSDRAGPGHRGGRTEPLRTAWTVSGIMIFLDLVERVHNCHRAPGCPSSISRRTISSR